MIAIVNIGPAPGNRRRGSAKDQPQDPLGPHLYQLRINSHVVAAFTHSRGEALSTCLRRAADAAENAQAGKLHQLSIHLHSSDDR